MVKVGEIILKLGVVCIVGLFILCKAGVVEGLTVYGMLQVLSWCCRSIVGL